MVSSVSHVFQVEQASRRRRHLAGRCRTQDRGRAPSGQVEKEGGPEPGDLIRFVSRPVLLFFLCSFNVTLGSVLASRL